MSFIIIVECQFEKLSCQVDRTCTDPRNLKFLEELLWTLVNIGSEADFLNLPFMAFL